MNYRPLDLLNQNAKFGSKALDYRLNQVLPSLLDVDQFGFVPGRDIRHALRYFHELQDMPTGYLARPCRRNLPRLCERFR